MKFLGREDILRPLVILRQHAPAYNRIIALGTDSAKHTLCSIRVLLSGVGGIKRKLSRYEVNVGPNESKQHFKFEDNYHQN